MSPRVFTRIFTCKIRLRYAKNEPLKSGGDFIQLFIRLLTLKHGFFNVARRGSDSEGNLWSQDHSQPLSAEQDLLSRNHKIRGSYYGMCPEFLFTLSKLMSLLSEVDDPSTIDPNVIQWHAWQDMLLWEKRQIDSGIQSTCVQVRCNQECSRWRHRNFSLGLEKWQPYDQPPRYVLVDCAASLDSKQKNNRTMRSEHHGSEEHIRSPRNAFAPFFNERGIPEI